jgi:hypothetical protein
VNQLQGATSIEVRVGGVSAQLCDAAGTPIPPSSVKATLLDTQGTAPPYHWTVHFIAPPGQGRYVPIVLTRVRAGDTPTPTDFSTTLNYAPATIAYIDVTLPPSSGGGANGNSNATTLRTPAAVDPVSGEVTLASPLVLPTAGGALVTIVGTNLGPSPYLQLNPLSRNTSQVPWGGPTALPPTGLSPCWPPDAPSPGPLQYTCWTFPSLVGEGGGLSLGLWQGPGPTPLEGYGAPQRAIAIPWSYAPPTIASVAALSPTGDFPTEGGVTLEFRGENFGRAWGGNTVTIAFGLPSEPLTAWTPCGGVAVLSQTVLHCTLPPGSGGNLSVAVSVSGVVGITPNAFSYAPPVVLAAYCSGGATPGSALPPSYALPPPLAAPGAMAFPLLRGDTRGGAVVTLIGRNFGNAAPGSNCAFLSWAGAPVPLPPATSGGGGGGGGGGPPLLSNPWGPLPGTGAWVPFCNGVEDWLGEGEVFSGAVVSWNHTVVSFAVPPGLGLKHVQLSIRGNLLHPPRTPAAPLAPPATTPYFLYNDPVVYSIRNALPSDALPPALVNTDGGDVLIINGTNFGPSFLNVSFGFGGGGGGGGAFTPLPLDCATSTPCAPQASTAFPMVQFHRYCLLPSKFLPGYAVNTGGAYAPLRISTLHLSPIDTTAYYCNPGAATLISVTHTQIVLRAPPGLGADRNVSVSVLSAGWGSNAGLPLAPPLQQNAPSPARFSYAPPTITYFIPSVVRVRLPPGALPVVGIVGVNFGTKLNFSMEGVSGDVGAWVSGYGCGAPPGMPFLRATDSGGISMLTCVLDAPNVLMGPAAVTVSMGGQVGTKGTQPPGSALLLACDAGYYGRPNETCLPCPAASGANPTLNGAACDGFLDYLPNPQDPNTYLTDAAKATLAYTAPHDPRCTYPRPLPGWFNLNSSDKFTRDWDAALGAAPGTTSMAPACPATAPNSGAESGRDVCIVPCAPPTSCAGNNYCTPGYASKPPMFRCSSCDKGFYKSANQCIPCPASPVALVVAMGLILVAMAGGLFYLNKRQVDIAVISIGVDFFQVLAIFADLGVQWPPAVLNLMRFLSAFNLNIEIVAPECLLPNLSYIQKFGFIMLLPIAIASVFALMYTLLFLYKRCCRGIRDRRKVFSHTPAMVSSLLVLVYLLYLYLTRTLLSVFDCTPTMPPDGYTYLKVVFERCGVPGGTQLTLLPVALAGLGFYTVGYPFFMYRMLSRNKELIYEDQLLRAKGTGLDRLTNPHALDFRRKFGRSYFQFKPKWYLWVLVIISRKFCIATVAVIFSNSVGFQMASCLMIMFLAYTLQVQVRPYMASDDYEGELKLFRDAVAAQDPVALRLKATLDAIESRGRKRTPAKSIAAILGAGGKIDRRALMRAVGSWVFNYNTVEAVMCFCAVIVCLSGLMYQAEMSKSTGLTGTIDAITGLSEFSQSTALSPPHPSPPQSSPLSPPP